MGLCWTVMRRVVDADADDDARRGAAAALLLLEVSEEACPRIPSRAASKSSSSSSSESSSSSSSTDAVRDAGKDVEARRVARFHAPWRYEEVMRSCEAAAVAEEVAKVGRLLLEDDGKATVDSDDADRRDDKSAW
jgi:hypothetical protein